MSKAYLFYGTQFVDVLDPSELSLSRQIKERHGQEIYNGGYVYAQWLAKHPYEWWRCDLTPVLLAHVPKELRALQLLLTI